jgi:hypothetical protein
MAALNQVAAYTTSGGTTAFLLLIDTLEGLDAGLGQQLKEISEPVRASGRVAPETTRNVITFLCRERYRTIRTLSALLGRDEDYPRQ